MSGQGPELLPELVPAGRAAVRAAGSQFPRGFWAAVELWLERPQLANRRLSGAQLEAGPDARARWDDVIGAVAGGDAGATGAGAVAAAARHVILRTLVAKAKAPPTDELVVKDLSRGTVTFLPLEEGDRGKLQVKKSNVYQIRLRHVKDEDWCISVLTSPPESWDSDGLVQPKPSWLGTELLSKLTKWSGETKASGFKSTLSLISVLKYTQLYQELKDKYKGMAKVWPEVTDPEKFVFEDVAIATYLLVLWEEERSKRNLTKKQSFVDLGCGNGLLVHILNSEGHPGKGIDVRRRKIWAMYGPQTHLEECAIWPDDSSLFPDVDWLIGNHSDELTPWIPVIAARSSSSCCYFVLPCCFFDFVGKFSRRRSGKSQYRDYLDFVTEVGRECGFQVEEDCLRIPSTKRVCLIGRSRTYATSEEEAADGARARGFSHRGRGPRPPSTPAAARPPAEPTPGAAAWAPGFRPRDKEQRVRNCASLPRELAAAVVLRVAGLLLAREPPPPAHPSGTGPAHTWDPGESLPLATVAGQLDRETLRRLKSECGGLQTLLKNNHQVFEVVAGQVRLRDWREGKPEAKRRPEAKHRLRADAFKTRLCWFFLHHPDGCPLPAQSCPYAHGARDLSPTAGALKKKNQKGDPAQGIWTAA
ncbi:probable tRNA (uracil-O(2)-)-methyltransferase [Tachyglossus aculeatus]|uniref:probable tRNA (uracil-O(2)-)-methyltransferase n=1 Tax=Tachyglossus aculeatus TaxID=9261 RepID=UPI0018F7C631|nr:probable tRNA (uracil-O(2)-)-methyltransferase [Tachyglossus aculeatus]